MRGGITRFAVRGGHQIQKTAIFIAISSHKTRSPRPCLGRPPRAPGGRSWSRRHSRRRAWARRGWPGRCRVAGLPPSCGAPSLGGRGDHLGSPRGRVGRPIRLLAGGRRRLRDFGRPSRLQPGRAAPAGSWGRRAVGPTPYASRSGLSRGVKVGRVSVCGLRTGSGREPAGPAEAVCPSTVDPVMA